MRKIHRAIALIALFFGLYVAATGTLIQLVDLRSILGHAPPNDPDMQAIRDGRDGPPNFQVLQDADFAAQPLPDGFDFDQALARLGGVAAASAAAPMSYIEWRMVDGRPVAQEAVGGRLLRFDALGGEALNDAQSAPPARLPPAGNRASLRNTLKNIHRMTAWGDLATIAFFVLGLALFAMIATGLTLYYQLWRSRARLRRPAPFWSAGGAWRSLHRACAVGASVLLGWVAFTGLLCAIGSLGVALYRHQTNGVRPGLTMDMSSPLPADLLPPMLRTTLTAYHAAAGSEPIKVLRLRTFAGMQQGVVVYGHPDTRQLAFNASTGARARLTEAGYPRTGQTFGWQGDQLLKALHRGDFMGMAGRWLSLLTGCALLFMSASGAVLYFSGRKTFSGRTTRKPINAG